MPAPGRSLEIQAQPRRLSETRYLLFSTHPDETSHELGLDIAIATKIPGKPGSYNRLWITNEAAAELVDFLTTHLAHLAGKWAPAPSNGIEASIAELKDYGSTGMCR